MANQYPVISWDLTVAATADLLDLEVWTDGAGGGNQTLALDTGTYAGFATDGSGNPTASTLATALATLIAKHSNIDSCAVAYDFTLPGWPRVVYSPVFNGASGASAVILRWTHGNTELVASDFGFLTVDTTTGATVTADFNAPGFWAPGQMGQVNAEDQQWTEQIAFQSRAPLQESASYVTRRWGSASTRPLRYDGVGDEWVRAYRASDTSFSSRSSRNASDPNNLLESLVEAAAKGSALTLWTADNESTACRWRQGASFAAQSVASDWAGGGAGWWVVDLPLEVTS